MSNIQLTAKDLAGMTERELEALIFEDTPTPASPVAPEVSQRQSAAGARSTALTEDEIGALLDAGLAEQRQQAPVQPATPQEQAPAEPSAYSAPAEADPVTDPEGWQREATARSQSFGKEPGLRDGSPVNPDAVVGGAAKAVFETKDFLFGETPPDRRNAFRTNVEQGVAQMGAFDRTAAGFAQFGAGMLGVGKLAAAGKVVPWFGKLASAGRGAKVTAETAKAAAVGAVAFDPYEDRLSNLIQGTPLANPITDWLKADPADSRAYARTKAAMESIGMDAALIGTFMIGSRAYKWWKSGNLEEGNELLPALEKTQQPRPEDVQIAEQEGTELLDEIEVEGQSEPEGATGRATPSDGPERLEPLAVPPRDDAVGAAGTAPEAAQGAAEGVSAPAVVDTPTQAAAQQGVDLKGQPLKAYKVPPTDDFNAETLLSSWKADTDAIESAGGFSGALLKGHKFGKSDQMPMQWLSEGAGHEGVDALALRMAEAVNDRIQKQRGGKGRNTNDWASQTDAELIRTTEQFARAYGEDPTLILGSLQAAAKSAKGLPAQFEVGVMLTNRLKLEATKLGARIQMGDYSGFGSRDAALLEFKRRTALFQQTLGDTLSIRAAGGRVTRRGRGDLDRPDAALKGVDGEAILDIWMKTENDPATLRRVLEAGVMQKVGDYAKYVLVNNLVSGPKTQIINILTNGAMMGVRPLEKIIGASAQRAAAEIAGNAELSRSANRQFRQAMRTYGFYAAGFADAWSGASKAFLKNDSILIPHRTEAFRQNVAAGGNVRWRSMADDDLPAMLHNALMAAHVAIGLPTRGLGFVDELVKQTVYRASLSSRSAVRATDEGMARGLKGDALRDFVRQEIDSSLSAGFDEMGRGLDPDALREAETVTFSQDLLPGTFGKHVQGLASNNWAVGMLLPFVKTPTNALRYGWKLSPGLNILQTEFRQALIGKAGPELQAEAVGQFALGSLAMGVAATAAIDGRITGGGPKDPKAKAELMATGWQPYSFVHTEAGGSRTYVPFGRLDPVALPLGITADIVDMIHVARQTDAEIDIESAILAPVLALSKQFREKSYLLSMSQALDAVFDDDPAGGRAKRFFGNMAANMIPYSAALRQANPDDTLREARSVVDRIMATVPGLSDKLPPRRDAWGDPVTAYGRNLFASDDDGSRVDREMQRLFMETGAGVTRVAPRRQSVDLRDIVLKDGRNAYDAYAELAGHLPKAKPLKEIAAKLIASKAYQRAPDGDRDTKGTKINLLAGVVSDYRNGAMNLLQKDPAVRDAFLKDRRAVAAAYQPSGSPSGGGQQAAEGSSVLGLVNGVLGGGGPE